MNSSFHRFGVTIRAKEETKRDRRIGPDEEKALLDAALAIGADEHKLAGASMHDRLMLGHADIKQTHRDGVQPYVRTDPLRRGSRHRPLL